jgi:tRNA (guanine26-N2/guanine27-N2)-dimethyltransferase
VSLLAQSTEWAATFDLIDIDAFGTGAPEISSGVLHFLRCGRSRQERGRGSCAEPEEETACGALLYACSTASVTAAGLNPQKAQETYEAKIARHAAVHEQGLRLLITVVRRHAREAGLVAQPLFSYYHRAGGTFRVMFRVLPVKDPERMPAPGSDIENGLLRVCWQCGQMWCSLLPEKQGSTDCPGCQSSASAPQVRTSGPIYLGPLHDPRFVERMLLVANEAPPGHFDRSVSAALQAMLHEATRHGHPFYYRVGDLARRAGCSPPPLARLLEHLEFAEQARWDTGCLPQEVRRAQWRAARASVDAQGIRTGLPMPAILLAMQEASCSWQRARALS